LGRGHLALAVAAPGVKKRWRGAERRFEANPVDRIRSTDTALQH
jgi:hypothetical protein